MTNSTRPCAQQAHDFFAVPLRDKRVPPLVAVLMREALTSPPRPLGPPEGLICKSNGAFAKRKSWPNSVHKLREQYSGYQPGYETREAMKYGDMPDENAPLSAFVFKRLDHGRAVWSAEIDTKRTRRQFDEWLPLHLDFQTLVTPLWPDGAPGGGSNDGWALSLQFLRLACGLPRFVPCRQSAA